MSAFLVCVCVYVFMFNHHHRSAVCQSVYGSKWRIGADGGMFCTDVLVAGLRYVAFSTLVMCHQILGVPLKNCLLYVLINKQFFNNPNQECWIRVIFPVVLQTVRSYWHLESLSSAEILPNSYLLCSWKARCACDLCSKMWPSCHSAVLNIRTHLRQNNFSLVFLCHPLLLSVCHCARK